MLVAAAAAAPAAGFGPPGFHLVEGGRPAACLQGAGERLAFVAGAVGEPEIRLLAPSPTAAAPFGARPALRPGPMLLCPQVAASPDGRVVAAAAWVGSGSRAQVRVVVEGEAPVDAGGAEGRRGRRAGGPRDRGRGRRRRRGGLGRAGGRAPTARRSSARASAWRGARPAARSARPSRSAPSGASPARPGSGSPSGVDAAGAATVALAERATTRSDVTVDVFAAPARDAPLGPPQRLGSDAGTVVRPALAVTPGGRALVAYGGDRGLVVHERATATEPFGPAARVGDGDAAAPAAALAPDGGAVVAWRSAEEAGVEAGVVAASRAAPGPFGTPQRLALGARPRADDDEEDDESGDDFFGFLESLGGVLSTAGTLRDDGPATPRLALAPGGAFTVAWLGVGCACERGDDVAVPRAAAGTLADGPRPAIGLGAHLRAADAAVAYVAHGEPGVAWADNDGGWVFGGYETPWRAGRVGASTTSLAAGIATLPKPPVIEVRAAPQRVAEGEPIHVRVTCDAACDIRAVVPDRGDPRAAGAAALSRAGTAAVRIDPAAEIRFPRRTPIVVRAAAPAGGEVTTKRLHVRVGRGRPHRLPRIVGLTARRDGRRGPRHAGGRPHPVTGALVLAGFRRSLLDGVALPTRGRNRFAVTLLAPADRDREGPRLDPRPAERRRAPSERGDRVSGSPSGAPGERGDG